MLIPATDPACDFLSMFTFYDFPAEFTIFIDGFTQRRFSNRKPFG